MAWHQKAGSGVHDLCNRIMEQDYTEINEAGVTVEVLFAYAPKDEETGEPLTPAVKVHGVPAAAKIQVMSQANRAAGSADVRITVDGDRWQDWSDRRQEAVLAHEIHHIELKRDEEGNILLDDCHRPKIKLKQHDLDLGVFFPIMKRYGEDAIDTKLVKDGILLIQAEFEFNDESPDQWFKQG